MIPSNECEIDSKSGLSANEDQLAKYREFLSKILSGLDDPSYIGIFHHVRKIPYGGVGQRDPRVVYEQNRGTCSGKHILLRDLLRVANYKADVLTIFTHFNKKIPIHASMLDQLVCLIREGEIPDYHNVVQLGLKKANGDVEHLLLDATWPDDMGRYGFLVNSSWDGLVDTIAAGPLLERQPICENVVVQKKHLLLNLSEQQLESRALFLDLLTSWIAKQGLCLPGSD